MNAPKPTSPALLLWRLIPTAVKSLLKCRLPLKTQLVGGTEGLCCVVGTGTLKWLLLSVVGNQIQVKVIEVGKGSRTLCEGQTTAERLANQLYMMATKLPT